MINCFTYTFYKLQSLGKNPPKRFEYEDEDGKKHILTDKSFKRIIKDYEKYRDMKLHYKYFESFCEYVNVPRFGDIIIDDNGVGVAVNQLKYLGILEGNGQPRLFNISKEQKYLRVK